MIQWIYFCALHGTYVFNVNILLFENKCCRKNMLFKKWIWYCEWQVHVFLITINRMHGKLLWGNEELMLLEWLKIRPVEWKVLRHKKIWNCIQFIQIWKMAKTYYKQLKSCDFFFLKQLFVQGSQFNIMIRWKDGYVWFFFCYIFPWRNYWPGKYSQYLMPNAWCLMCGKHFQSETRIWLVVKLFLCHKVQNAMNHWKKYFLLRFSICWLM